MNNTFKLTSCGCAMMALLIGAASCAKDDAPKGNDYNGAVTFRAALNASVRATETAFEAGDRIGVFAVKPNGDDITLQFSNHADNVPYIFDGERFNPETDGIMKEEDEPMAYYAVYPYQDACGPDFNFEVKTDQSSHQAYTAGDLCTVSTSPRTEADVELKFYHRLSRLVVNLSGFNIAGDINLQLLGAYVGATADLNANRYQANPASSQASINAYQESANSYSVIIPPQSFEAGADFVKANINGRDFTIKTPANLEFASGRQYSYNVTLINGELVLGNGIIMPWDNQTIEEEFSENYFAIENANFVNAEFEAGTDDSDPFQISANESALAGGMNFITINCEEEYEAFEFSAKGMPGYWEYIPEQTRASRSYTIPILYGPELSDDMEMVVCGRKSNGQKSVGYGVNFRYVESKSGDLNINLTFSTPKDVDLHLITPSGTEIFFGNRGGTVEIDGEMVEYGLDHDSNAGCHLDYLNNENIFIPAALIEEGTYTVKVNMWRNCNTDYDTDWSIVARYKGEIIPNEYSGYGNPASGNYPAYCDSGDHTTVMQFTLHPGTNQQNVIRRLKNLNLKPRKLTEAELDKIETYELMNR